MHPQHLLWTVLLSELRVNDLNWGCVLSANASTTACFTADEMEAGGAVILTVINCF